MIFSKNLINYQNYKYDKRKFFKFYLSLLKSNHVFLFLFYPKFDFNSRIIKVYLFFFNFATYFFTNALFFTDETMGKINIDRGDYNFLYNLPKIIYSFLISTFFNEIIKFFVLTEGGLIEFRNRTKKETILKTASKLKKIFKIKFAIFFVLNLILVGFFWIYLACFCAVYHNTQLHLIKDTIISFGTSFFAPFSAYLLPGIFRSLALKNKNLRIFYELNKILQFVL